MITLRFKEFKIYSYTITCINEIFYIQRWHFIIFNYCWLHAHMKYMYCNCIVFLLVLIKLNSYNIVKAQTISITYKINHLKRLCIILLCCLTQFLGLFHEPLYSWKFKLGCTSKIYASQNLSLSLSFTLLNYTLYMYN